MNQTPPAAEAAPANRFLPTVENTNPPPGPAPDGMVWIPGGEFSMGAQDPHGHARRRRDAGHDGFPSGPSRLRGRLLDGRDRSDERTVRALREGDRLRHGGRADAARRRFSRRAAARAWCRVRWSFLLPTTPFRSTDPYQWWSDVTGASWRHPLGPESSIAGQGAISRGARRVRGRARVRAVGRQAAADRSGMGVCGARRPDRAALSLGQ